MAVDIHAGKRIKESYKIKGARKFIAARMTESRQLYPQGTGSAYVVTDNLLALKNKLRQTNPNVTMTSLFVKLAAEALKLHPLLNSALIDNEEFFIYESVNVGVGIGLPEGIMSVVIKEAQDKNIFEISDELQDDIAKLKAKKLPMDRMMGSTFTLSNMGMLGVEQFTPFINPPETDIVGIGMTKKQVVVNDDGTTSICNVTCLSNTVNHAAVDGLHGGEFFMTFQQMVTDPESHMGL